MALAGARRLTFKTLPGIHQFTQSRSRLSLPSILRANQPCQVQQRSLSTTCACRTKQINIQEDETKIVVEAKIVDSPREKYLAKLPSKPTGCMECPLCKLGLTVRHTDVLIINQFITSKGKQLPREVTGLCKEQHQRMDYLIVMAEKSGLIDRDVNRIVTHNEKVLYAPEEWEDPHFKKYYDETVIDEFIYSRRKRH